MAKSALMTVLTRGFVTFVLILQSSLWTRLLAPEGRGLYAKLQAGQNCLILFLGFGLTAGIVYYCSSKRAQPSQLWTLSLATTAFSCILTGLLIAVGRIWPDLDFIFPVGYESLFFSLYFFFYFLQTQLQLSMNSFLSAEHQFAHLNQVEIVTSLLRLLIVAAAYFLFHDHLTLEILFALDFLAHTLRTALFIRYFRRLDIVLRLVRISWTDAIPVLRYSAALYCLGVVQFLYQRIDIWIIERWSGLAALGIFSCAMGLAQYLTILPMALNTVLMPHMSRTEGDEAYAQLRRYSRINATLLSPLVLLFALFPERILFWMFGSAFVSGAMALRVLGFAYWFASTKHVFIFFNASQNRLRLNFIIETVGLIAGVSLNFLWIPKYGIEGAAYAFLVTGAFTQFLSFLSVRKFATLKGFNYFLLMPNDARALMDSLKLRS